MRRPHFVTDAAKLPRRRPRSSPGAPIPSGLLVAALALTSAVFGCSVLVESSLADKPEESAGSTSGAPAGGGSSSALEGAGGGGSVALCGSCDPSACCSRSCVDLATSRDHCGACDNACLAGRACVDGACTPQWTPMSTVGAPTPRQQAAAAWIGTGFFVWGGRGKTADLGDGGIYRPASDTWQTVSTGGAPSARTMAAAVWTGSRVLVFGGGPFGASTALADGGSYNPSTNTWSTFAAWNPAVGRRLPIAAWTGSRMLVWGGEAGGAPVAGGALYDPLGAHWTPMSEASAPSARTGVAWAWTGKELLLFGGRIGGTTSTSEGYAYDPAADAWAALSTAGAPSPRYDAFAAWLDGELLIWGGRDEGGALMASGGRYDRAAGTWLPVSGAGDPGKRAAPFGLAGWTGRIGLRALLLGGVDDTDFATDGRQYDRATDTWTPSLPSWPSGRAHAYGIGLWTDRELLVWGGLDGGELLPGGERFKP